MAQIDEKQIEEIVSQVLKTLQQTGPVATAQPAVSTGANSSRAGVFGTAAEAIAAAKDSTGSTRQTWFR